MGRRLIESSKQVKIMGEDIKVNAKSTIWKGFRHMRTRNRLNGTVDETAAESIFVTHGEFDVASNFIDESWAPLGTRLYPAIWDSAYDKWYWMECYDFEYRDDSSGSGGT